MALFILIGAFAVYWTVRRQKQRRGESGKEKISYTSSSSEKSVGLESVRDTNYEMPGSPLDERVDVMEPAQYQMPETLGGRLLMDSGGEGISGVDRLGGRVSGSY